MISQVERDLVNPSIAALKKISEVLDTPVFALFDQEKFDEIARSSIVVRRAQRKRIQTDTQKASISLLVPDISRRMDVILIEAEPGARSAEAFHTHPGEECEFIIQGTMEVEWDGQVYTLHEGDSIYIDSSKPHRWQNPGDTKLVVLCSLTPPEF